MSQLIMPNTVENKPRYDLNVYHKRFLRGGLTLWVTWDRITGRPCMVITPDMQRMSHENVVPCVVPLDRAWAWSEEVGDEHETNISSGIFCANLGMNPLEPRNVFAIKDLIRNHLGDLIACPPLPVEDKEIAADALIHDASTGKVTHKEIKDHA